MNNDIPLTPEDVTEIVAILDGSPYDRLDIKTSRLWLRVVRDGTPGGSGGWTCEWDLSDGMARPTEAIAVDAIIDDANMILAPLPGTFYRAPQPGAPPFVEVGSEVGPDSVIGIIETMKLMNPVHAGATGTISEILVENGDMVAKRAALMRRA